MFRQEFEKHPELAKSIQLLAVTQSAMTLTEWNAFIENLCAALVDGDAALKAENAKLRELLQDLFCSINGSGQLISHNAYVNARAALGEDR